MLDSGILRIIENTIDGLENAGNVLHQTWDDVKDKSRRYGSQTRQGNYNYVSNVKNLSPALTVYLGSDAVETNLITQKKRDIKKSAPDTIKAVHRYIQKAPVSYLKFGMGAESSFTPECGLYISTYRKDTIHLAKMACANFFPSKSDQKSDFRVVVIPEWQEKERQILVFPEIGITYILGSDYFGEIKNAYLRMAMWTAKNQGMLGLHAATQIVRAKDSDDKIKNIGLIMFGIAATGKTTHACHDHGLNESGEGVEIVQDDVVFWKKDGSALGSERSFYVKTEGLSATTQPILYHAAMQSNAILENVMVDAAGEVYFDDRTLTPNGRAIIQRHNLGAQAGSNINLPPLAELDSLIMIFMVKNYTVVPIVSRLTPEQAAVAFMLSESIDAAGSDQTRVDISAKGIGSSPFIIGSASDVVNRFYELIKAQNHKIECYMLNTGGVGELVEHGLDGGRNVKQKVARVQIQEMASVIRSIARGRVSWKDDSDWMVQTPAEIDGLDISKFNLLSYYDQHKIDALMANVRQERSQYASLFEDLHPEITSAIEF